MPAYDDYIRFENENTALVFRSNQYSEHEYEDLLCNVMSLANANVHGPRHIVIGVEIESEKKRTLVGIRKKDFLDPSIYRKTVREYIEPAIKVNYVAYEIDGRIFGILVIDDCEDKPYMMRKEYSKMLRTGDAWIRRGARNYPVDREGLESIYANRYQKQPVDGHLEVSFSGTAARQMLELPVLAVDNPPLKQAAAQIKDCIRAKERADDILGHDDSKLQRLMHVNIYGTDTPFEARDLEQLKRDLKTVKKDFAQDDKYYYLEENAHKVNITIMSLGAEYLEDVSIVVEIPIRKGLAVSRKIYTPDSRHDAGDPLSTTVFENTDSYPTVERQDDRIRVTENIGSVPHHKPVEAFRQPLRIAVSSSGIDEIVPLYYAVFSRNLRRPVTGRLEFKIVKTVERQQQRFA